MLNLRSCFLFNVLVFGVVFPNLSFANAIDIRSTAASEKPHIIWFVEDKKENADILSDSNEDISTATYIEKFIISQLTQYNIQIERVSAKRINYSIRNKENACVANRANTSERRTFSIFSSPQAFYLAHKLFRFNQKDSMPDSLFNEKGEIISLVELFKKYPNRKLGAVEDVSLGEFLDSQMALLNKKNIYYRGGNNRVTALEAMLYRNRVDYLVALPVDINPSVEQKKHLERYTIAGTSPYIVAHFNCSNSALGKQVINDINLLLNQIYNTEIYYDAHRKTFTEDDLQMLQEYLIENYSHKRYIKPN